jgi:hypothetical protein
MVNVLISEFHWGFFKAGMFAAGVLEKQPRTAFSLQAKNAFKPLFFVTGHF